ncbi:MAG: hypothetical protein IT518_01490 [Burkholderiales bacterium]|nr:hypothetical protein [Burkholderiales bacterium]
MTVAPQDIRVLAAEAAALNAKVGEVARLHVLDLIGFACAGYRIGTWRRGLASALDAPERKRAAPDAVTADHGQAVAS